MTTTSQMEMNPNGGSTGEGLESTGEEMAVANNSTNLMPGNVVVQKNVASVVGATSTQRALDATKRKKLKSRSGTATAETPAAVNKINRSGLSYSKDHLDAWLENCLRDATNAQLSSSSEFLDFIPPTASAHKQMFVSQQQQMQQQQLQQQQQQLQQQQQQVPNRSQSYGMGTGTPFSLGIQRHSRSLSHRYPMLFPPQGLNGYGMGMGYGGGDGGQEFASLPPLVNMMGAGAGGTGSEHEPNSTDVLDGSGSNPNFSRGFRFSDPCLLNPSDSNDSKLSGQNTPDCRNGNASGGSGCDLSQQNKFFAALMEQINILHDTNSKICRNLHETKVDIEALKHPAAAAAASSQVWTGPGLGGMRHRRDSLSGLSTQSQPMVFGGGLGGTHSPAPTFHSGAYTPGMMTDVVREVKEAARVREDAMLSRVKSMVDERQWTLNEGNVRILRDIDDLKSHVMQLRLERKETNKRLSHLEAENKYLRQALAGCYNQRQASSYRDIIYENDRARGSRKPFPNGGGVQGPRRAQSFNLHYGTMHQTPTQATHSLEEDDEVEAEEEEQLEHAELDSEVPTVASKRLSSSSNESRSNGLHLPASTPPQQPQQSVRSPPTFALISEQVNPGLPPPLLPRKKEHAQLKRELSEAAAARKEANQRIIALEKLVKDLSAQVVASQSSGLKPNVSSTAPAPTASSVLATKFTVADGGPFTDL
ncbi:uncharacterized protein [Drosophila kikkawai]|uniref:Uncharacterized protein isoform X1 n=1 Tax=Drosophila kikkawai TaxID=30033 RepID=A0A6P4J5Z8_DROKI|nr:uncharacterized protein LOC108084575 isoform X1 [Drosophila kikkawai]